MMTFDQFATFALNVRLFTPKRLQEFANIKYPDGKVEDFNIKDVEKRTQ